MEQQHKIWLLLSASLKGKASDAELCELEQELRNHPSLSYYLKLLLDLWEKNGRKNEEAIEKTFKKLLQNSFQQQKVSTSHTTRCGNKEKKSTFF
ncbi:MAG TPA: hypothetical protein VFS36_08490 [Chitinophagaceae bacterium]|jgi:hypothetical protein|nr:hypothetical protein [Chitinophagaceae bacterium]